MLDIISLAVKNMMVTVYLHCLQMWIIHLSSNKIYGCRLSGALIALMLIIAVATF